MDEMMNISFHADDDVKVRPAVGEQMLYEWTVEDLKTLCSRIKEASLRFQNALNASYTKTENRLDWEEIAFAGHDSEECRTKWQQVCSNIRTYRTMAEIVEDAEQWLSKGPRSAKVAGKYHPDKPSRPPTIFFKFLMEQLPKVKAKYPELTHRQIVSKIGAMYKTITPKKLNQLKAEFLKEQESYKTRLEEFYQAHPGVKPTKVPASTAPKGTSGLAFFIAEKMQDPMHANSSKEELRAKWLELKDKKKVAYIEMALEAHRKNAGAASFMAKPTKDVLSKEERIIYDRFLGKPEKPPMSGFALFKSIASATKHQNLSVAERNKEITLSWNNLSRPDQNKFNNEVKIFKQQYDRKMAEYLDRLAQREQRITEAASSLHSSDVHGSDPAPISNGSSAPKRVKLEESTKCSSESPKKPHSKSLAVTKPSKKTPKLTALAWYQESQWSEWRELNPGLSDAELRSAIAEDYATLSEKKKQKWARKAEKENERRKQQ
ncbi:nucleolar transcription factor 1 [Galendromus occidentalis]|uniref:Nucleolar transcription factor 1 n=1 Tax=Galendromus occidentalis TaxID=34638 RepID=A0AAJ6QXB5_9ACAR|nr:nucleolar transcription factor 1 [Galendromus occidentalis]